MRCATYNVHRCIGRDGREDPSRVATVLTELQADVIGLQEVGTSWEGEATLFDLVAETGLRAVASPLVDRGAHWQGNALLTRHSILDVGHACISVPDRERRGVLDVVLGVDSLRVRVMVIHFGLAYAERKQQVRMLLQYLERNTADAVVVMGDFNEWRPRSWTVAQVDSVMHRVEPRRSFPTPWPVLALDRIWTLPEAMVTSAGVHRSPTAKVASDHFPVWADLTLPRAETHATPAAANVLPDEALEVDTAE